MAFAFSEVDEHGKDFLKELVYVGMIGFLDPPRLNIKPAILACKKAGIKIVMITGDHPLTSLNIAKRTGILTDEDKKVITGKELPNMEHMTKAWEEQIRTTAVFARTTPKQKLEIVTITKRLVL